MSDELHFRLTTLLGEIAEEAGLDETEAEALEEEVIDLIDDRT